MSEPIRGTYNARSKGAYAEDGYWDDALYEMFVVTVPKKTDMLLGTEVDIYPAGEPRYTEGEYAEKLHSMLREIEEAQPDSCAITALIPDMLMVDNEDVPVFGVVQNIHNATESFDEDMYVTGDTPIEAAEKVLGAVVKEKSPEDITFTELLEKVKVGLAELAAAIDDVRAQEGGK